MIDQPITHAWLLENGFKSQAGEGEHVLHRGDIETRRIYTDDREDRYWSYHVGRHEVPLVGKLHPHTQGQLHKLLAVIEE
jgi:hypothetical protein